MKSIYLIHWAIYRKVLAYNNTSKECASCFAEKVAAITAEREYIFNKKFEFTQVVSKSRHKLNCTCNLSLPTKISHHSLPHFLVLVHIFDSSYPFSSSTLFYSINDKSESENLLRIVVLGGCSESLQKGLII